MKVGEDVKNFRTGDRVCVEPGVPCGKCVYCREGEYNLCPDMRFLAAYPVEGSMQEYLAFPEENCFKLPEQVSTVEGALIEPLAVGLYAAEHSGVKINDTVVILGMGSLLVIGKRQPGSNVLQIGVMVWQSAVMAYVFIWVKELT